MKHIANDDVAEELWWETRDQMLGGQANVIPISDTYKVGVVGYSGQKFNVLLASKELHASLNETIGIAANEGKQISIVSGYTNLGIPRLVYHLGSTVIDAQTVGIACKKALDYECFPCTEVHLIGEEWGDESDFFLHYIDALIRVGGGKQSLAEVARFKELFPNKICIEKELPALD